VEKVGNSLKEDLTKPGYKSKHESIKRLGWLDWGSQFWDLDFTQAAS
jgi:hypothetical protein